MIEFGLYVSDLIAIPEILEIMYQFLNPEVRKLTVQERKLINLVYLNKLDLNIINIEERSKYFKNRALAFVGFNTIFFNSKMSDELLIHELCHCWQYQQFGSVYIIRALLAQHSSSGYDYGGRKHISDIDSHNVFQMLNYEQMAEVMTHYYLVINPENYNSYIDQDTIRAEYLKTVNCILA